MVQREFLSPKRSPDQNKSKNFGNHAIKVELYNDGTKVDYCDDHPGSGYRNLECSRIAEADEVKLATSLFDCNGADKSLDVYEISGPRGFYTG